MSLLQREEFTCKCGCGLNNLDEEFYRKLVIAREIAGVPFVITSGRRCPKHNKDEGGSPTSSHLKGLAADIAVRDEEHRYIISDALKDVGFTRLGTAKSFTHVDMDPDKNERREWVY